MGVLFWGPVTPQFSAPLAANLHQVLEVQEVLYHHAKFGGAQTLPAAVGTKNVVFCLLLCLSVRRTLDGKVWENDFTHKLLELRSGFDIVGQEKVCSSALMSTLSLHH